MPDVEACFRLSEPVLRILIRQNADALRELQAAAPLDPDSSAGRQHWLTVDELRAQTRRLYAALDDVKANPPAPRRKRSWRDLPPPSQA
ncbi:hypothetical protein [Bradyrhizobium sp. BR 1433]|uniref:hypothetical protein n=1 Tax=Bradyrhizobium sp. BR 1433 TaxID=3447967 RepID=UPI003EE7E8C4